jgi:hypothetical protein
VSVDLPNGLPTSGGGDAPKKDYAAIARRLDADLLDWSAARRTLALRLLSAVLGIALVQALLAFGRRRGYDVILRVCDSIPARGGDPQHVVATACRTPQPVVGVRWPRQ